MNNLKEKYTKRMKKSNLATNIDNMRKNNQKKIEKEFKKTIKDLGKNRIKVTEKNRTGEIKLNVTTNKRTLCVGLGALVVNAATLGLLTKKIKNHSSKKNDVAKTPNTCKKEKVLKRNK